MKTEEEVKAHADDILKILREPWASPTSVALGTLQRANLESWLAALIWVTTNNTKLEEMRELVAQMARSI